MVASGVNDGPSGGPGGHHELALLLLVLSFGLLALVYGLNRRARVVSA